MNILEMNHSEILIDIYILNNCRHLKVGECTNNIVCNAPSKTIYNYTGINELLNKQK